MTKQQAKVRSDCGVSAEFPDTVGLNQGSALNDFQFVVVLDVKVSGKNDYGCYCMPMSDRRSYREEWGSGGKH